jgi:hypothetical protein
MSPLADAIYELLRRRTRLKDPRITYKELAAALRDYSDEFEFAHQRNPSLYRALAEVGEKCRQLKLPPLPALVVRADTKRPGDAYYQGSRFDGTYRGERINAWRRDLEAVRGTTYPRGKKPKVR